MRSKDVRIKYRYISFVLMAVIFILMAVTYPDHVESARKLDESYNYYRVAFTFGTFLIGVLLVQERLIHGIVNGFSVRWFEMIIALMIFLVLLLPATVGMKITGFGTDAIIMQEGMFRSIMGVSAGVIFGQALTYKDEHL